jgi:molybdopterin converting factor small subunit
MSTVTLRYWASAKDAAGVAEEDVDAGTLAEALAAARRRHADSVGTGGSQRFAQVLQRCSYLVDGDPVGLRQHDSVGLADGATVEVLPPFAGG